MNIPRYWEQVEESAEIDGRPFVLRAWGHAEDGPEAARAMAVGRLPAIRKAILGGRARRSYGYRADAIREIRIQTLESDGREHAVVTRNGYGALVLNSDRVMFIDIDIPEGVRFLGFGKSTAQKRQEAVARVEAHVREHPGRALRIYETAGGLRLAALDKAYAPDGAEASGIMEALGVDPMYLRLCRAQRCFRARLTPKPWRLALGRPPFRFPEHPEEAPYVDWLAEYEKASRPYRACSLLKILGRDPRDAHIASVLGLHDKLGGVQGKGELR